MGAGMCAAVTRRRFLGLGTYALTAVAVGCSVDPGTGERSTMGGEQRTPEKGAAQGRLLARPKSPEGVPKPGLHRLGTERGRDGLLYVPAGYRADRPAPFALMLHGAGGEARHGMSLLQDLADDAGMIVLAPASRRQTWDVLLGRYGPDVDVIDRALEQAFGRCAVDPTRVAVGGFSDGASYALSLGLTNGDLFTHVIALSPGFVAPASHHGSPRLYVSHGSRDGVLPIEACSRRIVPHLKRAGYDVVYREFDGPHTVPPEIAREAVTWFAGASAERTG